MKYRIDNIGNGTWLIEEYDKNMSVYMYLLEGNEKALLIDTGFGTIPLKEICKTLTNKPIMVILTHGHADHIGGSGQFEEVWLKREDEKLYQLHAKEEIRRIFTKEPLFPVNEQLHYFEGDITIPLGERDIQTISVPGHSVGSICLLDKNNRLLYTGDTCCKAHVLLQLDYAAPLKEFRKSIQKLIGISTQFDATWPSHHKKPVEKEILKDFLVVSDAILSGQIQGKIVELPMRKARLVEYKEIGIEY